MRSWTSLVALGVVVLAAGLGGADAQHAAPPAVPGGPSAHMLAQTCATAFEKNIATGRGSGWHSSPITTAIRGRSTCSS